MSDQPPKHEAKEYKPPEGKDLETIILSKARSRAEARIISKAWKDENFRRELLSNPRAVAERELGITAPAGVRIHVHEETPTDLHFVLPMNPVPEAQQLSEAELGAAATPASLSRQGCWWNSYVC